jgi:DNA repair exonuclease SbcCD ATPase subunit
MKGDVMAGKSASKSRSTLKPKAVKGKKVASKKQPKVKPPVKKTKAQIEKQLALKEAKARLKILKSALKEIRVQVKAERKGEPPSLESLQAAVSTAQSRLEKVQSELGQAKALSRKRKDEIDEWKGWYAKLPEQEKPAGLISLNNEISWRAAELDTNGQRINELMLAEIEATGALEMANQKLAAFKAGVHKLPIERDPRLKGVLAEVEAATAEVAKLSPKKK